MKIFYTDGEGVMEIKHNEKHPTRRILEQGGFVDEESFELMLREEAKQNRMDTLESIEENLIQVNKTLYAILKHISSNQQD